MRRTVLSILMLTAFTGAADAKGSETAGTAIAVALPLFAAGYSAYQDDWKGVAQLTVDTVGTVGTVYALKQFVKERRPDGSDYQSFPSDTAALAFAPAQFLWDRYGWQIGVPAYAAAIYSGWTRVDAKKHHWYDVAASAGFAFGFSKVFTTRYHARGLQYGVNASPSGVYAGLHYSF